MRLKVIAHGNLFSKSAHADECSGVSIYFVKSELLPEIQISFKLTPLTVLSNIIKAKTADITAMTFHICSRIGSIVLIKWAKLYFVNFLFSNKKIKE